MTRARVFLCVWFFALMALVAAPLIAGPMPAPLRAILERSAGEVVETIDAEMLARIAGSVAEFAPPDEITQPGFEWIALDDDWPVPEIRSRDWAFAREGLALSLAGALGEGQAELFDAGFWCFLQAALIAPDEVQHLVNVAFHLNERARPVEAEALLRYALELEPDLPGALNNLAYAEAEQGNYFGAIAHMWKELATGIDPARARARLARYYRAIGQVEAAETMQAAEDLGYVDAIDYEPVEAVAREVKRRLWGLWEVEVFPLNGEIAKRFPIESQPWEPYWQMSEGEQRYFSKNCPYGTCSKLGGINIGHYLGTGYFRGSCRARQPECQEPNSSAEACTVAYCQVCIINALEQYVHYDWENRAISIARQGRETAFARGWMEQVRQKGFVLLDAYEDALSYEDYAALLAYWNFGNEQIASGYEVRLAEVIAIPRLTLAEQIAYSDEAMDCVTGAAASRAAAADAEAAIAERERAFQDWLARQPHGLCPNRICANWDLPLGPLTLTVNPRNMKLEAFDVTLGIRVGPRASAGLKFGWNLKKSEPKFSLGFSVPMAGYTAAGASIGWTPSTGLAGHVTTGGNFAGPDNVHPLKTKTQFFHLNN